VCKGVYLWLTQFTILVDASVCSLLLLARFGPSLHTQDSRSTTKAAS